MRGADNRGAVSLGGMRRSVRQNATTISDVALARAGNAARDQPEVTS